MRCHNQDDELYALWFQFQYDDTFVRENSKLNNRRHCQYYKPLAYISPHIERNFSMALVM